MEKKQTGLSHTQGQGDTAQLTEAGDVLIQQVCFGIYCVSGSKVQRCSPSVQSLWS